MTVYLWYCTLAVFVLNVSVVFVHLILPAAVVDGYVCHVVVPTTAATTTRLAPLKYRLNGFGCLLFVVLVFGVCVRFLENKEAVLFLSYNYGLCAVISNALGLLVSAYLVYVRFPGLPLKEREGNELRRRAPTDDCGTTNNKTMQQTDTRRFMFFHGKEFTPRWHIFGRELDLKMVLYVVGAVVLELNVLSALCRERLENVDGGNSMAMLLYATMFTWFCCEYLYFERIHLYTYDLFAEKVGFKLAWGCLCFYPYFYPIGMIPMLYRSSTNDDSSDKVDITTIHAILIVTLFLTGWVLTRGANMQKYYFRRFPKQKSVFGGLIQQTALSSSDKVLCSGFWGLAKHVNYFGEILQAVALAMPGCLVATGAWWMQLVPLLYPLYYVALFIPRQFDDDEIMRQKYGDKVMDEYTSKVPYRIVPYVY